MRLATEARRQFAKWRRPAHAVQAAPMAEPTQDLLEEPAPLHPNRRDSCLHLSQMGTAGLGAQTGPQRIALQVDVLIPGGEATYPTSMSGSCQNPVSPATERPTRFSDAKDPASGGSPVARRHCRENDRFTDTNSRLLWRLQRSENHRQEGCFTGANTHPLVVRSSSVILISRRQVGL